MSQVFFTGRSTASRRAHPSKTTPTMAFDVVEISESKEGEVIPQQPAHLLSADSIYPKLWFICAFQIHPTRLQASRMSGMKAAFARNQQHQQDVLLCSVHLLIPV
ncbi:hypothetical protein TcWFU_007492 [Taenia crassiceps]|uniref:Uncharacterized protein n=1 Tax=Taenia crassiceps TaxID=6207 RepID=A0ABR4Q004_9CEST